jgi:hypothetical protein
MGRDIETPSTVVLGLTLATTKLSPCTIRLEVFCTLCAFHALYKPAQTYLTQTGFVWYNGVMANNRWTVEIRSVTVVIGRNPENADMGNPNGDYYGDRFYAIATAPDGQRRRHEGMFRTAELAEDFYVLFAAPIWSDDWFDTYPEYGSPAYEAVEPEVVAAEKRDALDYERFHPVCALR